MHTRPHFIVGPTFAHFGQTGPSGQRTLSRCDQQASSSGNCLRKAMTDMRINQDYNHESQQVVRSLPRHPDGKIGLRSALPSGSSRLKARSSARPRRSYGARSSNYTKPAIIGTLRLRRHEPSRPMGGPPVG
jgi:hypothetical protein